MHQSGSGIGEKIILSMGAGLIDDFIRNILSIPFCPCHFVRTILSNTILSVYHFVRAILSVPFCPLPFCPVTPRGAPDTARILCRNFTPKRHRQLWAKDLPRGPYVAARAGVEPMTLRTKDVDSTKAPPRPTTYIKPI